MNRAKSSSAVIRLSMAVFLAVSYLLVGFSVLTAKSGPRLMTGAMPATGQPATNSVQPLAPLQPGIVISQVYGGGGNSGAQFKNDFIELFNRGTAPVDVTGWSVQYTSATGTAWQVTPLTNVMIQPGQYYLIQEAAGTGTAPLLPTPDATGAIAMAAASGKVALVNNATALTSCTDASIIDKIGYGSTANCSEAAPAPGLTNTTADLRAANGCSDTDTNSVDFAADAPNPRNTSTAVNVCPVGTPTPPPTAPTAITNPVTNVTNISATLNGSVNPNGGNTTVHFEYGLDTNYGSSTANQILGGSTDQSVSATVGSLTPSTTYHYRIVATNSAGTTNGNDVMFVTATPPNPFTGCDLVVYRVGDGSTVLTANAAPVFLDEYTAAGVLVQSIAMPIGVTGSNKRLTAGGNITSEGLLTESADGAYLIVPGYDANVGDTIGVAATAVNRVVGRVSGNATLDTTTALTDAASSANLRSAASTNGLDLWVDGSNGGIRYATLGATTSTQLSTAPTNLRAVNIFGGQLYVTSQSGTTRIAAVGTGTPTASGQTITELPGIDSTNLVSPYAFFFADLDAGVPGEDTLYVADDSVGAIDKFSLVSGSWVPNGAITAAGVRGLTGKVNGTTVTLYATSATDMFTFTDPTGYNGSVASTMATSIATAGANMGFRGVAFAPVQCGSGTPTPTPTPSTTPTPTATPLPTATPTPSATTNPATNITGAGATLNGTVNPNGASTTVHFEYGLTTSYGSTTANQVFTGNTAQSVSAAVAGLNLSTTYHYRIVAVNGGGTTVGSDAMFTTLGSPPPTVTTSAASNLTTNAATVNGTVNPNGATTNVHFEYGLTTSYGSSTADQIFTGSTAQSVTAGLSGLTPGTLYHFRLVGQNNGGTVNGGDMTFTTIQPPPIVATGAATTVTMTTATVNGTVNPNGGSTTAHFEYGLTTSYGSATPNQTFTGTTLQNVTANLTALTPNTLYHFRLVGTNSGGTTNGGDLTLMTAAPTPTPSPSPCTNLITNSSSFAIEPNNSTACLSANTNFHTDNSYWRAFNMQTFASGQAYVVTSVSIGIQQAGAGSQGSSAQPVDVRVYANNSAPFPNGVRTLLASTPAGFTVSQVLASAPTVLAVPLSFTIPAGTLEAVMEVHTPNGVPTQAVFFIGSNHAGQIAPSYLSAADCNLATPTDLATLGHPDMQIVMTINGNCLGTSGLPTVTTTAPSNVTSTGATLNGTANPNGSKTTVYFEYGTTTFSSTTAPQSVGAGIFPQNVSANIAGLTPGTMYHVRMIGINAVGSATSNEITFTTAPPPLPTVATGAATNVTDTGADLNGTVNPNGPTVTTVHFEYGTTTDYGSITPDQTFTGTTTQNVTANITGLTPFTTVYHFRIVGTNVAGTVTGNDVTFGGASPTPPPILRAPLIAPGSGTFKKQVAVTITSRAAGAVVHYTTNGDTPTSSSRVYHGETITIKAVGVYTIKAVNVVDGVTSDAAVANFTITKKKKGH